MSVPINDDGRVLSYLYDAASNRTRLNYPGTDNFYLTYSYDALNRLDTIREKGSLVLANYDYDPLSRRSKLTYGNGRIIDYDYALDSAITEINHRDLLPGSTDAVWSFDYTDANQVETRTTPTVFLWTAAANETIDYTVNGLNAYTSVDGQGLTYDNNGSLTGDGVWSYGYDVENRLISATDVGGPQASFGYDPLGRRDSYTVNGTTTRYLSDGIEEIADYSSSGTLLRRYVHGLSVDEHLVMYTGTSLSSKQYYHTDHQGTSVAMSSNSGTLLDQYTYSAFGEVGAEGVAGNPFRYTGRRLDAETGLYYYRARYYSPALGRFLQTDPIGYEDQINLYAYVGNDPLNYTDPTGMSKTGRLLKSAASALREAEKRLIRNARTRGRSAALRNERQELIETGRSKSNLSSERGKELIETGKLKNMDGHHEPSISSGNTLEGKVKIAENPDNITFMEKPDHQAVHSDLGGTQVPIAAKVLGGAAAVLEFVEQNFPSTLQTLDALDPVGTIGMEYLEQANDPCKNGSQVCM